MDLLHSKLFPKLLILLVKWNSTRMLNGLAIARPELQDHNLNYNNYSTKTTSECK